ncbi:MAG: S41 family peptidase [Actinobacteria bacterium]|nr:S41 family peptidase [Actinomycetota bacterium]
MDLPKRILAAGLAVAVTAAVGFVAGYTTADTTGAPVGTPRNDRLDVIKEAYKKIQSTSVDPPGSEDLTRGAIRGMVDVLKDSDDPYALFYTPKSYRSFHELTSGQFSGIGVWLKNRGDDLEVVSVLPSTPALAAGVKRGDLIRRIDRVPVGDLTTDEAVAQIKGPEGTMVSLQVDRGTRSLHLSIRRQSIDLPNVVARMTEAGDLGYVRLFGFARGAGRQVRNEVGELQQRGAEGIVLDLRDNGGGLFSEAIDVASVFIEDGRIVSYKERSNPGVAYEAEGNAFEEMPLVVLVNEGTASASEIVAGALQDRERAIVIGASTYGKGSVQEVVPLRDASALKLTTAAYLTPRGRNIDGKGIKPDVLVEENPIVQRQRAVEILRGLVVSMSGSQG